MTACDKRCVICGESFTVPKAREKTAKTCSLVCRGKLIAKRYEDRRARLTCAACGVVFSTPPSHAKRRRFCSDACADRSGGRSNPACGESHYNWKGGKSRHREGYSYMRAPDHPFASNGYVFEHRLLMEERMLREAPEHPFLVAVGERRFLRRDIEIHHRNGDKRDNSDGNLLACTGNAHKIIHLGGTPAPGTTWPESPV